MKFRGRPSKFKKEYCEKLIEHFRNDGFMQSFCEEIDIVPSTFYQWVREYPEFSNAFERASNIRQINLLSKISRYAFDGEGKKFNNFLIAQVMGHAGIKIYSQKEKDDNGSENNEVVSAIKELISVKQS